MIFTKRSDYGLRAALELAAGYGHGPLSAHQIAVCGGLPEPFVRKLLQDLAAAGIAQARRGRAGGYKLTNAPSRISVREVLEALEELAPVSCMADRPGEPGGEGPCAIEIPQIRCPTRAAWQAIDLRLRATLDAMTLDDLLAEVRGRGLAQEMVHGA